MEAVLAAPEGPGEVVALGWQPPYPPRSPLMRRYAYAAALADRIAGQAYRALEPAERRELADVLAVTAGTVKPEE